MLLRRSVLLSHTEKAGANWTAEPERGGMTVQRPERRDQQPVLGRPRPSRARGSELPPTRGLHLPVNIGAVAETVTCGESANPVPSVIAILGLLGMNVGQIDGEP